MNRISEFTRQAAGLLQTAVRTAPNSHFESRKDLRTVAVIRETNSSTGSDET